MKNIALTACFAVMGFLLHAQNKVSSKVIDAVTQEPLIGVNIQVEGSTEGTVTNIDGYFELELAQTSSIKVSYLGYTTTTFTAAELPEVIFLAAKIAEVSQVVVSASRFTQDRADAALSISTLTPTVIDDARPKSLDEVLNKVPGVFMVNLGNEQHTMAIRQPISYKSLFLYLEDGLPIRPTGVFNHNALIEMDQAAIRQIEVIRGPSSSIYGSEAIGGAINFITQRPTAVPTASIRLQGNNLGYRRVDLSGGATIGKLGIAASGHYNMRRNGIIQHSDFDKLALSLKATYRLTDKDFLEWHGTLVDYQTDMTGSLDSVRFYEGDYSSLQTFTNRSVWAARSRLTYKRFWNDNSQTHAIAFIRDNSIKQVPSYRVRDDYSPWGNPNGNPNLAHGESNDNSFQSYGLFVQHRQRFKPWNTQLTGGLYVDYSPNSYVANYISIDRSDEGIYTDYTLHSDSLLTDYQVGLVNPAAFAQLETSPHKNLKIIAAFRFDAFVYDYNNNLSENAFSGAPDNVDLFSAITPKIGFTYSFDKKSGVYANFSQGFVPPQITELYRGVMVPVLSPSTYNNIELGGWMYTLKDKLYLDVSLYQMNGFNEIISVRLDNGESVNQNAGKTLHRGIEYGITYAPIKDLSIRIGGTNAQHKFLDYNEQGNDFSGNIMPGAPAWILNSEVTYKPRFVKNLRVGLEVQHLSPYFMDASNEQIYKGFTILNARAGYEYKGFEVFVNAMNITNQLYSTNVRSSQWGQTYTLGLPLNINVGLGYNFVGKKQSTKKQ